MEIVKVNGEADIVFNTKRNLNIENEIKALEFYRDNLTVEEGIPTKIIAIRDACSEGCTIIYSVHPEDKVFPTQLTANVFYGA